jgi:hypothetical protein
MQPSPFIQWLLSARTASIRLLTLTQLLDHSLQDIEVRALWGAMRASGPIPAILSHQTKTGHWSGERNYYTPKYTSTHWNMILLTELAADPQDAHMKRGALFMLGTTWDELQARQEKKKHGWTCLWANILRYAYYCQFQDDPRLRTIIETLVYDALEKNWRCPYNDEQPCAWGVVRTLWALSAIPEERRNPQVLETIQSGLHFLLDQHHLVQADYPTPKDGRIHPLWFKLNFPLFYQSDILFTLRVLAELNALDHPSAQKALDWLESLRQKDGRWHGSSPFRSRTWPEIGDHEETDRWVSLHAALVLKAAGRNWLN